MSTNALVIFTDIRGFTSWARDPEVFDRLNEFVETFIAIIKKRFPNPPCFVKCLGDGAMVVQEINGLVAAKAYASLLAKTLETIDAVETDFAKLCEKFSQQVGERANLRLGWGIVRGPVKKFQDDYVGPNVNKAARLCDVARPFGIVADASDFTIEPVSLEKRRFFRQTRKLTGAGEVEVWVTDEVANQFVAREKLRQQPEVHVAGMCLDTSNPKRLQLLLARRSKERKLSPGLFEGCGGQLALSERFTEGVKRHFELELGVNVRVLEELHCFYEIDQHDEPLIPGIRFLCGKLVGDPPAKIESQRHSEVIWVTESKFKSMPTSDFAGNLHEEVVALLERYKEAKK